VKQEFKLVVPEELLDYVNDRIKEMNNKIVSVKYGHYYNDGQDSVVVCFYGDRDKVSPEVHSIVKKEWLQEIKQPETFDEWFDGHHFLAEYETKSGEWIHLKYLLEKCHKWTIENEKLNQEMKENSEELPEKIEEIKAGPVSDEQIIIDWLDRPDQLNKQMIVWKDDLLSLIHRVKHNERKRVQPVIDRLKIIIRKATSETRWRGYDLTASSYEDELEQALQQLKEQDKNRGN
jgi:hypothetical protein